MDGSGKNPHILCFYAAVILHMRTGQFTAFRTLEAQGLSSGSLDVEVKMKSEGSTLSVVTEV